MRHSEMGDMRLLDGLLSGFGVLAVACCLQVPKFAGSNPAEAVRIFQGEKILIAPFLGGK
jgi:hypothetical protein